MRNHSLTLLAMIRTKRTELVVSRLAICSVAVAWILSGCGQSAAPAEDERRPEQAGQPIDPAKFVGRVAAARAAAATGNQEAVVAQVDAMQDDLRRAMKLADPARAVDREAARQAARQVEGVRSVAWLDRENLFVIVERNEHRTYDTIDAVCLELEPLGDTLGVVVNLQSGAAGNGDELEILSRNCQLAPGDRALLSRHRQVDVISPELRDQHRRSQAQALKDAEWERKNAEAMEILEKTTPSVHD
ncbi:hypothetical protein [Arenimonas sp.]|uniref:hypothetical protein n=1 Tax=Arenimonas sp. TaxID=1872635 RepID=UPI0035B3AEBA